MNKTSINTRQNNNLKVVYHKFFRQNKSVRVSAAVKESESFLPIPDQKIGGDYPTRPFDEEEEENHVFSSSSAAGGGESPPTSVFTSASAAGGGGGASGGEGAAATEESNDYECTIYCSFHGNIETPLQYFSDSFNEEFWSKIELMQSVQAGCLSYPETEDLLTGLFSDEIGNKKRQYELFVKPYRQQKLASLDIKNQDVIDFLSLIDPNPRPTSEPKSDYYQPLLIFVKDLLAETPKKTCRQIVKETLYHIDTLISLQPHKYWGYKWFVKHREPEKTGEKYKTLTDLQMKLKQITKCNEIVETITKSLTELFTSFEEYHYIYYRHQIEAGSILKIYLYPKAQPLQSLSGKKSATDLFNRGISLIIYPNTKLFQAFELFCVEAQDFFTENEITKEDLYAEFKTKEGSLISSPNMKLFCHWLMETFMEEEKKEGMREILEKVTHDFNVSDGYEITSFHIFKFIEIIDACLKKIRGDPKKIKLIISTCRVMDQRINVAFNPETTDTENTQDWLPKGGKKTRRKRRSFKKTRRQRRKHK